MVSKLTLHCDVCGKDLATGVYGQLALIFQDSIQVFRAPEVCAACKDAIKGYVLSSIAILKEKAAKENAV